MEKTREGIEEERVEEWRKEGTAERVLQRGEGGEL